jgi:hypothetical protein
MSTDNRQAQKSCKQFLHGWAVVLVKGAIYRKARPLSSNRACFLYSI